MVLQTWGLVLCLLCLFIFFFFFTVSPILYCICQLLPVSIYIHLNQPYFFFIRALHSLSQGNAHFTLTRTAVNEPFNVYTPVEVVDSNLSRDSPIIQSTPFWKIQERNERTIRFREILLGILEQ